ncbi:formamidopyrimidine-DNA glycosylase [Catalinimonas alkaloidigena]|uniref:Formamidopyrimidine-DNA glycosylase n=1 Tax=Catalinimonas alkaloidigena TaxID=1075417 RepID=A0A1G9EM95_9BACT|nr:DNA-formamidopyrimidine glycosylase family protein [Catalinimonas alkaloidigena]SDK77229.1 formamidopyrimidine-DNA glycosylase [Catalinimonas alkaloidigena]
MPELPEVEWLRRYAEETALQLPIEEVLIEPGYEARLAVAPEAMRAALVRQAFVATDRIGKYLFLHLDSGTVLMMHFGMTGWLQYYRDEPPRFARFQLEFENGYRLALTDPRKFARLDLTDSVEGYRQKKKLSHDALTMSADELWENLRRRKTMIKPALLDQRVAAGVGNWIVDEVLFQTHLHPETRVNELDEAQVRDLHQALQRILRVAIEHEADYATFPRGFLIKNRWVKDHERDGGAYTCPRCESPILYTQVGGRGTYYCPVCQGT